MARNKNIYGDNITVNYDFCRKLNILVPGAIKKYFIAIVKFYLRRNNNKPSTYFVSKLIKRALDLKKRGGCQ